MSLLLSHPGMLFKPLESQDSVTPAVFPDTLFTSGETGDYFDPSDLTTLWQDSAGTVPVTANGQSVARMDGVRGSVILTATSGSRQPVYQTDGTFHWLAMNTDQMTSPAYNISSSAGLTVSAAVIWNSGRHLWDGDASDGGPRIFQFRNISSTWQHIAFTEPSQSARTATRASNGEGIPETVIGVADGGGNVTMYVDNVGGTPVSLASQRLGSKSLYLGARNDGVHFNGRFYGGLVVSRPVDSDERVQLHNWLDNRQPPPPNSISSITGSPTFSLVDSDRLYQWTTPGTWAFTADDTFTIRYLIVGGGGGGGGADQAFPGGGGGGGGGMLAGTFTAVAGQTYTVTVGAGGAGGNPIGVSSEAGDSGGVSGITGGTNAPGTAQGGGGGGGVISLPGSGGSGGGAGGGTSDPGGSGTAGQGNAGGDNDGNGSGAGGGGAGQAGGNNAGAPLYEAGNGGDGDSDDITGTSVIYAGGGGGGSSYLAEPVGAGGAGGGGDGSIGNAGGDSAGNNGSPGTDGLGGGGGGAGGDFAGDNNVGGDGGDGIVIIRFAP